VHGSPVSRNIIGTGVELLVVGELKLGAMMHCSELQSRLGDGQEQLFHNARPIDMEAFCNEFPSRTRDIIVMKRDEI
jgi:hypothetical protein